MSEIRAQHYYLFVIFSKFQERKNYNIFVVKILEFFIFAVFFLNMTFYAIFFDIETFLNWRFVGFLSSNFLKKKKNCAWNFAVLNDAFKRILKFLWAYKRCKAGLIHQPWQKLPLESLINQKVKYHLIALKINEVKCTVSKGNLRKHEKKTCILTWTFR